MRHPSVEVDALLTPAEVAAILYVDPKTVTRWAMAGKISCMRTPGGHRRFLRSEILALATVAGSRQPGPWPGALQPAPTLRPLDAQRDDLEPGRSSTAVKTRQHAAEAVVARAVVLARESEASESAQSVIAVRHAVRLAAGVAADAAGRARTARAAAASAAAEAVASSAGRTAAAVQRQADVSATMLREAAAQAAAVVSAATAPRNEHDVAVIAVRLATAAQAAAVVTARETAATAAGVATAVAAAAADVARTVSDLDVTIEDEVAEAAAAVQTTAAATARRVAAEMDARATSVALVARDALTAASLLEAHEDDPAPRGPGQHGESSEEPDGRP